MKSAPHTRVLYGLLLLTAAAIFVSAGANFVSTISKVETSFAQSQLVIKQNEIRVRRFLRGNDKTGDNGDRSAGDEERTGAIAVLAHKILSESSRKAKELDKVAQNGKTLKRLDAFKIEQVEKDAFNMQVMFESYMLRKMDPDEVKAALSKKYGLAADDLITKYAVYCALEKANRAFQRI